MITRDTKTAVSFAETTKFWDTSTRRLLKTINGIALTVSHDGSRLYRTSNGSDIEVADTVSGIVLKVFSTGQAGIGAAYLSNDDSMLITDSTDGTLKVWNAQNYQLLQTITHNVRFVQASCISPDGLYLAVGQGNANATIRIWDRITGALIKTVSRTNFSINSLCFTPNSTRIIASGSARIEVFDVPSGILITSMVNAGVRSNVSVSPDGNICYSGSFDKLSAWDTSTGVLLKEALVADSSGTIAIDISTDGSTIVTSDNNYNLRAWSTGSLDKQGDFTRYRDIADCAWSPLGSTVSVAGRLVGVLTSRQPASMLNAADGAFQRSVDFLQQGSATATAFSPSGNSVAFSNTGFRWLEIFDAITFQQKLLISDSLLGQSYQIAFSPTEQLVATDRPGGVVVWSALTGQMITNLRVDGVGPVKAMFDPTSGELLNCAQYRNSINRHNPLTGQLIRTYLGPATTSGFVDFSISGDGRFIAAAAFAGRLVVWDATLGTVLADINLAENFTRIAFSPNGKTLVTATSGSNGAVLRVWNPISFEVLSEYDEELGPVINSGINSMDFSPDGNSLLIVRSDMTIMAIRIPESDGSTVFKVTKAEPSRVAQRDRVTLTIRGTGFRQNSLVRIEKTGSTSITALQGVEVKSTFEILSSFDLSAAAPGTWDVVVKLPNGREARKPGALTIEAGTGTGVLRGYITAPSEMRAGRINSVTATWLNEGTGDMEAPIMVLEALDADSGARLETPMRTKPGESWTYGAVLLVGNGASGEGGTLSTGNSNSATIQFQAPLGDAKIRWRLSNATGINPTLTNNNWSVLSDSVRPLDVNSAAWNKVWNTFTAQIGPSSTTLFSEIRKQAKYNTERKSPTNFASDLLSGPLANATGEMSPFSVVDANTDIAAPAPGIPLAFTRIMTVMALDRTRDGILGLGWRHNFDTKVVMRFGNDVDVVMPDGRSVKYTRDGFGKWSGGDPGTKFDFYSQGDETYILTLADGSIMLFNSGGYLVSVTDTNNTSLTLEWSIDKLVKVTHSAGQELNFFYNVDGKMWRVEGPGGRSVTYTYTLGPRVAAATFHDGRQVQYKYSTSFTDPLGGTLEKITYPDGKTRNLTFDDQGRLTGISVNNNELPVTITYSQAGAIAINHPGGSSTVDRGWHGLGTRSQNTLGLESKMTFDTFLNTNQTSYAGRDWTAIGDEAGNLLQGTDPIGATRGASYITDLNRVDWFRDARGLVLDYSYDPKGNVTSIKSPNGALQLFSHTQWGAVNSKTNRRGQTTQFSYNADGQVISASSPDEILTYRYDGRGNQTSASSNKTGTILMQYNIRDEMTRIEYPSGKWFAYEYDIAGRRTQRTGADTPVLTYTYDSLGRLDILRADGQVIVNYDYDSASRLAKETKGNGTYTTYAYDQGSRPTAIKHFNAAGVLQAQYLYGGYDAFGNPATMTTPAGTWSLGYDAVNQLKSVTPPGSPTSVMVYDAEGNRITETSNGNSTSYATNAMNQYTSAGGATFTYDADGNMKTRTEAGQTTTYAWDAAGQLVGVLMPNGDQYAYEYDALGNRSKMSKNGTVTSFVYDGGTLAAEYVADGTLGARYLHGSGLVARQDATTIGYYGFDATGNTRLLTAADGSVANSYEVKPFGGFVSKTELIPNRFRFVGKYGVAEDETGLIHMRARYYDPGLGRFVSEDPIGLAGKDSSLYRYSGNNPVIQSDPSGLQTTGYYVESALRTAYVWWDSTGSEIAEGGLDTAIGVAKLKGAAALSPYTPTQALALYALFSGARQSVDGLARILRALGVPEGYAPDPPTDADALDYLLGIVGSKLSDDQRALLEAISEVRSLRKLTKTKAIKKLLEAIEGDALAESLTDCRSSFDPNDKVGPTGSGTERWIGLDGVFNYQINFENKKEATAHAQEVVVTDILDSDLDISTMELGDVAIADQAIADMVGYQYGSVRVPLKDSNLLLDIAITFDISTRKITWRFRSLDPLTGDLPDGTDEGLLPPNIVPGSGEGYVKFRIKPKASSAEGVKIENKASIVFDLADPIITNTWVNRIDKTAPSSKVESLPATVPSRFKVIWSGTDAGSGIASYDVYLSVDGGAYTLWKSAVQETSAIYETVAGKNLRFYSVARDFLGNVEAAPANADATTVTTRLPLPEIDSIVARPSGADLRLSILGGYYKSNAQVFWNGNPIGTQWVNEYSLVATVPLAVVNNAANGEVVVFNPEPEGGYTRAVRVKVGESGFRGVVDLRDWSASVAGLQVRVSIFQPGQISALQSSLVSLAADGSFLMPSGLPAGLYDVHVQGPRWLGRRVSRVLFATGAYGFSVGLVNGDIDGDNEVTIFDYIELSNAFMTVPGDAGWNPNADLDGDGEVTIFDYIILSNNFGLQGD